MWTTMTVCDGPRVGRAGVDVWMDIDEQEVRELNAIAAILEALAVRLAPAFDSGAIERLRAANRRFRRAAGDASALAAADDEVHRGLSERCGDSRLLETLTPVRRALRRWHAALAPDDAEVVVAANEHDAIIDALARGDHAGAAERLRDHVTARLPLLVAGMR